MGDELIRGSTRSGDTRRGYSKRYFSTLAEIKRVHKRVYGPPSLYIVGMYAVERER
jgi:hypothetical protein